jgi:hypothetical protein
MAKFFVEMSRLMAEDYGEATIEAIDATEAYEKAQQLMRSGKVVWSLADAVAEHRVQAVTKVEG